MVRTKTKTERAGNAELGTEVDVELLVLLGTLTASVGLYVLVTASERKAEAAKRAKLEAIAESLERQREQLLGLLEVVDRVLSKSKEEGRSGR
jgi:recombination DNA repair RAD52 pathway protein